MNRNQKYKNAKYLIFTYWETTTQNGSSICGSLYLDYYPETEDEAIKMLEQEKSKESHNKFPCENTTYNYGYHLNNKVWWTG